MKKAKSRFKSKSFIAMIIILGMVLSVIPFKVFANDSYTITFRVQAGTNHTMAIDGNRLKIDDRIVEPREATDYSVTLENGVATITINDGTATTLNFNSHITETNTDLFTLFANGNQINNGTNFSGNTEIQVQDYVAGTQTGGSNNFNTITFQLDGASISGNVITFQVDNASITATVSGTGYSFDGNNLVVEYAKINDVRLTVSDNFDNSSMRVVLNGQPLVVNGNSEVTFGGINFNDDRPHLQIVSDNGAGEHNGDNTQNYQGNATATLNYSINGAIEYTSGGGFDHGISFRINDLPYKADESKMVYTEDTAYERDEHGQIILDDNNNPIVIKDPDTMQPMTEKTGLTITGDTINYDYDTTTNKVNFTFAMAPGTLMTELVINGQAITNLPRTSAELQAHYIDHRVEIAVNDIDKANTYNIEITARYPNSSEEFMGNFLWDYNPQGYTSPEDKILNGTLAFVQAEYDGHVYTTPDEVNALGGVYIWRDAPRKKNYTEEREGCGEAQFPKGTILTVKIIPDAGYQLVDFGINGGVFEPQEEIGTYSFEVNGGPFHLQANIQQVDDVVKTKSDKISAGAINLGEEQSMAIGTARLDVKDIELTEDQISNFEEAADGYKVKNYLDISLYNTVYKGTSAQSWDTQVKNLDNEAEIILQLEDDVNGEDIVVVHEKHDGTYEIIPTEYLKEYNAIVFKTKSFSNYAIATKTAEVETTTETENTDSKETVVAENNEQSPQTGDIVRNVFIVLAVAMGMFIITLKFKGNRKVSKH